MQSEYLSFGHKIIMPSPWDLSEWQQKVPAWIRNYYFFIPGVENVELLNGLYKLMLKGLSKSVSTQPKALLTPCSKRDLSAVLSR